jgi:acetyl esterase/lipase
LEKDFAHYLYPQLAAGMEVNMKIYLYENRTDVFLDAFYPGGFGRGIPPISAGQPIPWAPGGGQPATGAAGGGQPATGAAGFGRLLPAVIICPGGGYQIVGTTEARPVSDKFTDAGYAAFILHYTVGEGAGFGREGWEGFSPVQDLVAAMRLLRDRAESFGIDASRIVHAGFSAGGHLCAAACFSGVLAKKNLLPKALILTYPMGGGTDSAGGGGRPQPDFDIARMPYADDPEIKNLPVFMWHAKDDTMVPFAASERLDLRLTAEGIPHRFLVYEHGIHTRPFFNPGWFTEALDWLNAL